ncbi:MAG: hypothetical protein ACK5C5_08565 [Bacteroidota bacterium]
MVETGVSEARKNFLKDLLEFNRYQVVVAAEAAKAPAAAPAEGEAPAVVTEPTPTTYKVGVTDVTFNTVNAIFGRLLRTRDGRVVTMAYWQQQESVSRDDVPYFSR